MRSAKAKASLKAKTKVKVQANPLPICSATSVANLATLPPIAPRVRPRGKESLQHVGIAASLAIRIGIAPISIMGQLKDRAKPAAKAKRAKERMPIQSTMTGALMTTTRRMPTRMRRMRRPLEEDKLKRFPGLTYTQTQY